MFKRGDIFVIVLVLALTVAGTVGALLLRDQGNTLCVTIDGQEYGKYALELNQVIEITGKGNNVLVIQDGQAYMQNADCPDKICVHHAPISRSGEAIVCLPNGVVAEVKREE